MLTDGDRKRLTFYSPVCFIRARQAELAALEERSLAQGLEKGDVSLLENGSRIFYRHLDWDSKYFGFPVFRVEFSSCADGSGNDVLRSTVGAYRKLVSDLVEGYPRAYVFSEVPSEDLLVLQGMGLAGFRLIETRLTFYRDGIQSFESAERYPTRLAIEADIPNLQNVARRARNPFDRYHADPFFSAAEADEYLAAYVGNSVRGFADMVIVPAPDSLEPGAFLTGVFDRRHESACSAKLARISLTAVAPERRGWNKRLNSELMHWFKERGVQIIYTTTQSTNRAAIRVLESLGYSFGRSTHVLVFSVSGKISGSQ